MSCVQVHMYMMCRVDIKLHIYIYTCESNVLLKILLCLYFGNMYNKSQVILHVCIQNTVWLEGALWHPPPRQHNEQSYF